MIIEVTSNQPKRMTSYAITTQLCNKKKNLLSEIPRQTDGNHGQNLVSLDIKGALEDLVDL